MPHPPTNAPPARLEPQPTPNGQPASLAARLTALAQICAALPNLDTRTPEDIIGYDKIGLWR